MERLNDRKKWFIDRIGKRVYRSKTECNCVSCQQSYENGLIILDDMHAIYLFDTNGCLNSEGIRLKYFDTIKERDKYEQNY